MNFERIIDIASEVCQKTVLILTAMLVVINIARCSPSDKFSYSPSDTLNTYGITADWCGSCPVADNYKTFKLSDNLQGQFLYDYGVRSIYDKIVTSHTLVCTGTDNQTCISIEVWEGDNIIKVYK